MLSQTIVPQVYYSNGVTYVRIPGHVDYRVRNGVREVVFSPFYQYIVPDGIVDFDFVFTNILTPFEFYFGIGFNSYLLRPEYLEFNFVSCSVLRNRIRVRATYNYLQLQEQPLIIGSSDLTFVCFSPLEAFTYDVAPIPYNPQLFYMLSGNHP